MKFEIEIPDDDPNLLGLASSIQVQLSSDAAKRSELAGFALNKILKWMAGRSSHQSMKEQSTDWLSELLPIFYPDEMPSTERVFNNFSIPYGRAAYISRVLSEMRRTEWRKKAKSALLSALNAKASEARRNIDNGDAHKYVPIAVDTFSYRELTVALDEILRQDDSLPPTVNKNTSPGGRRIIDVPSQLFPLLITKLES